MKIVHRAEEVVQQFFGVCFCEALWDLAVQYFVHIMCHVRHNEEHSVRFVQGALIWAVDNDVDELAGEHILRYPCELFEYRYFSKCTSAFGDAIKVSFNELNGHLLIRFDVKSLDNLSKTATSDHLNEVVVSA